MSNLIRLKQLDISEITGYLRGVGFSFGGSTETAINDFNYLTGVNNNLGNIYLNIINYGGFSNAKLPDLTNGARINIKKLNSGILNISGELNVLIDGEKSLILAEDESIELLGVKNSMYSGWISINSNGGV